jgi:hypothetical protein
VSVAFISIAVMLENWGLEYAIVGFHAPRSRTMDAASWVTCTYISPNPALFTGALWLWEYSVCCRCFSKFCCVSHLLAAAKFGCTRTRIRIMSAQFVSVDCLRQRTVDILSRPTTPIHHPLSPARFIGERRRRLPALAEGTTRGPSVLERKDGGWFAICSIALIHYRRGEGLKDHPTPGRPPGQSYSTVGEALSNILRPRSLSSIV